MRSVILYIFLVGIPALALLGILQLGQAIKPPTSVGGSWHIQFENEPLDTTGCTGTLVQTKDPALMIVQSGPYLQLAFNDTGRTVLQGMIERSHIITTSSAGDSIRSVRLQADLDRQAEPDMLHGQFTFLECASQPALSFTAVRQPAEVR